LLVIVKKRSKSIFSEHIDDEVTDDEENFIADPIPDSRSISPMYVFAG
jgi:hypothetical protein